MGRNTDHKGAERQRRREGREGRKILERVLFYGCLLGAA
jgi:hypothetical protein